MKRRFIYLLSMLLFSTACSTEPVGTKNKGKEPGNGTIVERVPGVYVLDKSGKVEKCFGYTGTEGKPALASLSEEIPDTTKVTDASNTPLQNAIDYARSNGLRNIRLDAAIYPQNVVTHKGCIGAICVNVPSNIHLKGVSDENGLPLSVICPSEKIVSSAGSSQSKSAFDVLMIAFNTTTYEGRKDPLNNTIIESVFLDAKSSGNLCFWGNGGENFKLTGVHSKGSRMSSMVVGFYRRDPAEDNIKSDIMYARNFEISRCRVWDTGWDAICAIGKKGVIRDNITEYGRFHGGDNGITIYIGSEDIDIRDNTIHDFYAGIGLDGGYLWPVSPYKNETEAYLPYSKAERAAYYFRTGYNKRITINNNLVRNCTRGVVLFRASDCAISNNRIADCNNEGISLEETINSYVWGNRVNGCKIGLQLASYIDSGINDKGERIGSSGNKIGYDRSLKTAGNDLRHNNTGIKFYRPDIVAPANRAVAWWWAGGLPGRIAGNRFVNNNTSDTEISVPEGNAATPGTLAYGGTDEAVIYTSE